MEAAKSSSAIEPPHASVVWTQTLQIAEEKLRDNNLPPLDTKKLTSESATENIGAVAKSLNALREKKQNNQWGYTARDGRKIKFVERLEKTLRSIEPYTKVANTVVQCEPMVGALVWGGLQAIIQVRIQFTIGIAGL